MSWFRNTDSRYGAVAMLLHWVIAAAILSMLALGVVMVRLPPADPLKFELYQLHKSIGVTVLVLSLLRLGWRLTHPVPPLPVTLRPWEKVLARVTHIAFYGLMIGLPVSGWMMVSASPRNIPTVVFGAFTLPHLPVLHALPNKAPVADALKEVHEIGAIAIAVLLALHVAGALKHHFILRDGVLARMLPIAARGGATHDGGRHVGRTGRKTIE